MQFAALAVELARDLELVGRARGALQQVVRQAQLAPDDRLGLRGDEAVDVLVEDGGGQQALVLEVPLDRQVVVGGAERIQQRVAVGDGARGRRHATTRRQVAQGGT
ncbi:hypothetical protein D3C72_1152700 [compost metagenome]